MPRLRQTLDHIPMGDSWEAGPVENRFIDFRVVRMWWRRSIENHDSWPCGPIISSRTAYHFNLNKQWGLLCRFSGAMSHAGLTGSLDGSASHSTINITGWWFFFFFFRLMEWSKIRKFYWTFGEHTMIVIAHRAHFHVAELDVERHEGWPLQRHWTEWTIPSESNPFDLPVCWPLDVWQQQIEPAASW